MSEKAKKKKDYARQTREIVEWDWVTFISGEFLHAPKKWNDPKYEAYDRKGETICGLKGWILIPGIMSRMAAERCHRSCMLTGMPLGTGSPKNNVQCRKIVQQRLKKLSVC